MAPWLVEHDITNVSTIPIHYDNKSCIKITKDQCTTPKQNTSPSTSSTIIKKKKKNQSHLYPICKVKANILTKALGEEKKYYRNLMGMAT
jgi:hypothetical protein